MGKRIEYKKGQEVGACIYVKDADGKHRFRRAIFICACGNEFEAELQSVKTFKTRTCGCSAKIRGRKHGFAGTDIYITWSNMKHRCYYKNHVQYKDWGGRGICVCEEWLHDFVSFYNHVSKLPNYGKEGYSIDRIDNDKNYYPGNVRWATKKQQANNTRRNILT